ncbi:uncharacterized protein LOC127831167 [Dreissena polymorpha]|uniref:uncharacterized protein LOC127831167 n=1 Tax=Dreissena polymorpha TaxID=45954 RepID=UPI002263F58D|nr:uncharacterized protein LOC127831167 [Dreissena polymorpha]
MLYVPQTMMAPLCPKEFLAGLLVLALNSHPVEPHLILSFFSNNQSLVNRCEVLPGLADHDAIFVESSLRPMRVRKPPRKVHLYKKADFDSLRDELSAYLPEFTENTANISVDHTWKAFENKLKSLISKRRRGCETQLLALTNELVHSMARHKQHDLAVLDFSKAFDRVPHSHLLTKLNHYGIRGYTLKWIEAFLTDRTRRVRLFADDCVVYREINSEEYCLILQNDLIKLAEWEKQWGMDFHPEKCSILRVHRKRNQIIFRYSLKDHILETDSTTKYLGVTLSQNLSRNHHMDITAKKGNSTLGFLQRNLRVSNEKVKTTAYTSLVRPGLEYCSTVWNPFTKDLVYKLEMVQRRAARYVTNRYHNTSSVSSMIEHLGWETLESRRTKAQLTMLYKIINDLVDIPANQYLVQAPSRPKDHNKKYHQPSTSTSCHKNSFFPRTISVWNHLPA